MHSGCNVASVLGWGGTDLIERVVKLVLVVSPRAVEARVLEAAHARSVSCMQDAAAAKRSGSDNDQHVRSP